MSWASAVSRCRLAPSIIPSARAPLVRSQPGFLAWRNVPLRPSSTPTTTTEAFTTACATAETCLRVEAWPIRPSMTMPQQTLQHAARALLRTHLCLGTERPAGIGQRRFGRLRASGNCVFHQSEPAIFWVGVAPSEPTVELHRGPATLSARHRNHLDPET